MEMPTFKVKLCGLSVVKEKSHTVKKSVILEVPGVNSNYVKKKSFCIPHSCFNLDEIQTKVCTLP